MSKPLYRILCCAIVLVGLHQTGQAQSPAVQGTAEEGTAVQSTGAEESTKPQLPRSIDAAALPTPPAIRSEQIQQAYAKAITFLEADQNANGSWGSPTRTKGLNIYAPIPGAHHAFRAGTTALVISALCELEPMHPEVSAMLNKAETWLYSELPKLKRADPTAIYNVWGHAYAIQALVRLSARAKQNPEKQKQISDLIRSQFERLTAYESVDGGWGYYDFDIGAKRPGSSAISFVAGTVLVAFHEAEQMGLEPPKPVTERAIKAILRQQRTDHSYLYGEYLKYRPMHPVNMPGGSLGRSQVCNLALMLWKDESVTQQDCREWLTRLITRNGWLDIGRKRPIPHESWFAVAGYFYYYGHYYAAYLMEEMPEPDRRKFAPFLAELMLDRQEKDGSWWDYPLYDYHQPYGSAFALMILLRTEPYLESSETE